jgi:phage regulator Rha-like protein
VKLRKQVVFTDEAWSAIEELTKTANDGFQLGHINFSDTVNAMIMSSRTTADALRSKHKDLKRTLKSWASKTDVDIDLLIKDLTELKGTTTKRRVAKSEKEEI